MISLWQTKNKKMHNQTLFRDVTYIVIFITERIGVGFASNILLSAGTQIILTFQSVVCSEGDDAYWT